MKEDCMGIYYNHWRKEYPSTSNSTTISSIPSETSMKEILKKDKENEKDSTINHTVNDLSNPNKLVMLLNSISQYTYVSELQNSNRNLGGEMVIMKCPLSPRSLSPPNWYISSHMNKRS